MNAVILKLQRGHGCAGVAQHKAELRRQTACGNLLHSCAVQIGYHTTQTHILAHLGIKDDFLALLHDTVNLRGDDQHAASFGHACFIHQGTGLADLIIDVFCSQLHGCGLGACVGAHNTVGVRVHFGDNHLAVLAGQSGCTGKLLLRFVLVQLINDKGERAVFLDGQRVGGGVELFHLTKAAAGGGIAIAGIVVHLAGADLVHAHSCSAVPCEILIGHKATLTLSGELFIYSGQKFSGQIYGCHKIKSSFRFECVLDCVTIASGKRGTGC